MRVTLTPEELAIADANHILMAPLFVLPDMPEGRAQQLLQSSGKSQLCMLDLLLGLTLQGDQDLEAAVLEHAKNYLREGCQIFLTNLVACGLPVAPGAMEPQIVES